MNRLAWLLLVSFLIPHSPAAEGGFKPLFTVRIWRLAQCELRAKTWTVMDGVIHCTGKPIGELRTTRMCRKLHPRVEWRILSLVECGYLCLG